MSRIESGFSKKPGFLRQINSGATGIDLSPDFFSAEVQQQFS
jgi:hypothetical protein